ncbi:hypothetical protein LCGC14_1834760 [marine sediment metagenome]|uniref:Uncharacterized protein n=1 Tax=marine sediment metagenome TaxID=412755 RepID=A0A0F9H382_9ZZZZ
MPRNSEKEIKRLNTVLVKQAKMIEERDRLLGECYFIMGSFTIRKGLGMAERIKALGGKN